MKTPLLRFLFLAASLALITSCAPVERAVTAATDVAERTGVISASRSESIRTSVGAASRSQEEFTPEQEYYIGRSVAAVIMTRYSALDDRRVSSYVNLLGKTLAAASDMPELFAGYNFLVLDSNEINAFATPGGHIFITRGLIRCCRSEDALAAVLAHEIGHVQLRHGMRSIEKARVTDAVTIISREALKTLGTAEVAQLTDIFGDAVSDITSTMINKGYSRSFEYQADAAAVTILERVGYNPGALIEMLTVMERNIKPGAPDFAQTHPSPANRIAELKKIGISRDGTDIPRLRTERFMKAVGHLL